MRVPRLSALPDRDLLRLIQHPHEQNLESIVQLTKLALRLNRLRYRAGS